MCDHWDPVFRAETQPSINVLELYAVVVTIYTGTPQLTNKSVEMYSDNTPTVIVINDSVSYNLNLMHLLLFLTVHCMLNNITLTTFFIPGKLYDIISFSAPQILPIQASRPRTHPLSFIPLCPLSSTMYNNLQL